MPSTDEKAPRTELHSTYIRLSWQNAAYAVLFIAANVGTITGLYWHMSARDDLASQRLDAHDVLLEKLTNIQQFQGDWISDIAIKTSTPRPQRQTQ